MPFHRFQDPTYDLLGGTFPGTIGTQTYDRANVVSGGTGGGNGSANADGAKVGGPNAGTFFVAFGEDATSSFANRGLRAVTQNTDALDNILRGNVPRMSRVGVSVVATADVPVTGLVFVGDLGTANSQANRDFLAHVEYADGTPVVDGNGAQATITLIHDGFGNNLVGTSTTGFVSGATIRLSVAATGALTAFVGIASSYANLQESRKIDILGEDIDGRRSDTALWINYSHGMDGKYRKSTRRTGGTVADLNVAGSGAVVTRDGKALTVVGVTRDWDGTPAATDDPIRACFSADAVNSPLAAQPSTTFDDAQGGNVGYAFWTCRKGVNTVEERGPRGRDAAGYVAVTPVDLAANNVGGDPYYTYLIAGTPAVLNPGGTGAENLRVNSPYFFRSSGNTGVALRHDLALVEYTELGVLVRKPFVIKSIVDDTTVELAQLGGNSSTPAPVFVTNTVASVTWLQVHEVVSGRAGGSSGSRWPSTGSMDHNRNRAGNPDDGCEWTGSHLVGAKASTVVQRIGQIIPLNGLVTDNVLFFADGSIRANQGYFQGPNVRRVSTVPVTSTGTSFALNTLSSSDSVFFRASGSGAKTITLTAAGGVVPLGYEFTFYVQTDTSDQITLVTPSGWVFSGTDKTIPTTPNRTYMFVVRYAATSLSGSTNKAYVTRTEYEDTP